VAELRRRGHAAYDADDDGYTQPAAGGAWRWKVEKVSRLLAAPGPEVVFFAGCSDEQAAFEWDCKVLLTAPEDVILDRLLARTTNDFGKSLSERERVVSDLREFEPLLRGSSDAVVDATQPLSSVVDEVLAAMRDAAVE
jgi:hypothetical protein